MSNEPQDAPATPAGQRGSGPNETMIISSDELSQRQDEAPGGPSGGEATVIKGIPTLVGKDGLMAGTTVKLDKEKTSIGRAPDNDVVIEDGTVSARHAQIINAKGTWRVVNLISTNGTAVNGRTNIVSYLAPGDLIAFGRVEMVFEAPPSEGGARAMRQNAQRGKSGKVHPAVWIGAGAGLVLIIAVVAAIVGM